MTLILISIFAFGYLLITIEHQIRINKAAVAVITGALMWTVYTVRSGEQTSASGELMHHLAEIAEILFFLLGAMTIVELIDVHGGFDLVTSRITTRNKLKLLWIISITTFFLSAVLDNLTTAIVMVAMLQKIIPDRKSRLIYSAMVVVAANAGGAWSPMGDVTTTMLWIKGQITEWAVVSRVLLPSLVCLITPLVILSFTVKGNLPEPTAGEKKTNIPQWERLTVLLLGVGGMLFVPVYKTIFHMPPYMGMLISLGTLWLVTELMHARKEDKFRKTHSAAHALERVDIPSILFFLGILLAVGALESSHFLSGLSGWINTQVTDQRWVITGTGPVSAVLDNVPLVKAIQGMYSLDQYPADHNLWHYLAYTSGTGGSMLIIGSAAGVAVMGMEKMEFFWYLRHASWLAAIGFAAGAATFLLFNGW